MEIEVFKELDRDLTDLIFCDQEKCSKAMTVSANKRALYRNHRRRRRRSCCRHTRS